MAQTGQGYKKQNKDIKIALYCLWLTQTISKMQWPLLYKILENQNQNISSLRSFQKVHVLNSIMPLGLHISHKILRN